MSHIDHFTPEELRAVLAADNSDMSEGDVIALQDFIRRIGGLENAQLAVEMLEQIDRAA